MYLKKEFLLLILSISTLQGANAFSITSLSSFSSTSFTSSNAATRTSSLSAGVGWGNDDFLNSLGGNDKERENETETYHDFKQSREAFEKRQTERMESPAGRKFMQQQEEMANAEQRKREGKNRDDMDSTGDFFNDVGMGHMNSRENENGNGRFSSGSSQFNHMMNQANSRMERGGFSGSPGMMGRGPSLGLEQKFAIPLDDDDDEE